MPRFSRVRLASTLAVLGVAACGSNDTLGNVTGPSGNLAAIRIAQGVSDAGRGVDVALNGTTVLTGTAFGSVVPATQGVYDTVPATPQLAFYATGSSTAFYSNTATTLFPNTRSTIVAFGHVASGATPTATAVVLPDTTGSANGAVLVRVFNTLDYVTPGQGTAVDVYVYAQGSARPNLPDVAALPYGAPSPYLVRPAATLVMDVFAAGASPSTGAPLFTTTLTGGAGAVRTAILLDPFVEAPAGTAGRALVLNDQQ